jgi:hypothetical protein
LLFYFAKEVPLLNKRMHPSEIQRILFKSRKKRQIFGGKRRRNPLNFLRSVSGISGWGEK